MSSARYTRWCDLWPRRPAAGLASVAVSDERIHVFEYGNRVDVMSGMYIDDYGTVVKGPIDITLNPWHVRVELDRAGYQRYVPAWKPAPRD